MKLHRRNVPITIRCDQSWSDLDGAGVERGCEICDREVTNISLLRENEARAFLQDLPAGECIAYQHTEDGALRFADSRRLPLILAGALLVGGCADPGGSPTSVAPAEEESVPVLIDEDEPARPSSFAPGALVLHEVHEAEDAVLDCETVRRLASLGYYVGRAECDEEE